MLTTKRQEGEGELETKKTDEGTHGMTVGGIQGTTDSPDEVLGPVPEDLVKIVQRTTAGDGDDRLLSWTVGSEWKFQSRKKLFLWFTIFILLLSVGIGIWKVVVYAEYKGI